MPVAKKSDVLREFQKWLVLVEWRAKKSVLMLRSDRGGEFLEKEFTDFVVGNGIVHDLTCPYTPQQNGMAEREMRTAVESMRTMLLHIGVQHHWWHLALLQAVWVRNCLERSTTPSGTTPYQLLTGKKPDLTLARVWGCMVQFMDVVEVPPPTPVLAPPFPIADLLALTSVSATGDEGSLEASPVAPAIDIAGGRHGAKLVDHDGKPSTTEEQQTGELVEQEAAGGVLVEQEVVAGGELSAGEESTDSDVVEVPITKPELQRTGRTRRPPERLSFHACLPPATFTTVYDEVDDDLLYDDAEKDEELLELDPDVHANPEHLWDIATMTNRWVLTTKYHIDDTVECEKARVVVKGFTHVCGADYDETYSPVSSYVTLRIFLTIVAVLDLNLMQRDMKNAFLQSKLNRKALDGVLLGTGWKKSQVDEAFYFKANDNGVTSWVLVYVDDLLTASSSPCNAEGAKGAARGCLRAARDFACRQVPRAGDRAQQASEEAMASPAGLRQQAAHALHRRGAGRSSPVDTAQALYDAVVARYSSPATAALGRLLLPYLFPELSAFATVEDLVSHLCTSDARYRAALPSEFLAKNPPPMYIALYFIVTRHPDSLRAVRDHFLALDPTYLTVDLLEQHLLAAKTSVVAVVGSAAAARARVAGVVAMAAGVVVGAAAEVMEAVEVVAAVGVVAGVGALVAVVEAAVGVAVVAAVGAVGVAVVAAVGAVEVGLELNVEVLEEARGSGSSVGARPHRPSSFTYGKPHTQHRFFFRLDDAWRADFGDEVERPHWAELLRSGVAIFGLDYDAILFAMYALSASTEVDCYLCVPPDPGLAAAALGASESSLPGAAPAKALQTVTLDSGASRCFFRDRTTLTPLSALVPVRLADPSGGPVVARSSTVLPCAAVLSGSLSACVDLHVYTDGSSPGHVYSSARVESLHTGYRASSVASAQVSTSGQVAPPCSCRLLSHQNLLWHHRLGHPPLPRLRGMHSRLLVSGLPQSVPPLPPSPSPPCLPCVEGRQHAAPHSSFLPTTAPLQTLHMDVWVSGRVSGQGR
ncbi:unnamed protein product [Closterium sp. NIES-54]